MRKGKLKLCPCPYPLDISLLTFSVLEAAASVLRILIIGQSPRGIQHLDLET